MAGDEPSSASPRAQVHHRTSSTHSASKSSTGQRAKTAKAHAVGKHHRNTSLGRNLNKLGMVSADKPPKAQRSKSAVTPSTSPSSANVRRNKSEVTLPRTSSKVQIKKNQSAVALRRNESASRLMRPSRPTTPKKDEDSQFKGHAQPAFGFGSDDDEGEDEDNWTEESASHSPVMTRDGSPKGMRPVALTNTRRKSSTDGQTVRGESPKTPIADLSEPVVLTDPSNPPDPSDITNRLLSRGPISQLAPKLSTISAGGSSGAQSPAYSESNGGTVLQSTEQISLPPLQLRVNSISKASPSPGTSLDRSLGKDGVSRFLDPQAAASSSGRSASQLHNAMGMLHSQNARSRSPSPGPAAASAPVGEGVRRAKSAVQLSRVGSSTGGARATSQQRELVDSDTGSRGHSRQGSLDDREWTMTIDPNAIRRSGGNTRAKMELWRSEAQVADAEPPGRPPVPLIQKMNVAAASNYLGVEERRVRMAEEAESELAFLRMFRNPACESAERIRKERKRREREARGARSRDRGSSKTKERQTQVHSKAQSMAKNQSGTASGHATTNSTPNGTKMGSTGSSGSIIKGDYATQTPTGSSRRSVRFDVGADGQLQDDSDIGDGDGESRLTALLRSLWEGAESEIDG